MAAVATLEVSKQTRGTGGGAVAQSFDTLPNSGAALLAPLGIAISDWLGNQTREAYTLYADLIDQADVSQVHVALDTLIALGLVSNPAVDSNLNGFEQYSSAGWDGDDAAPIAIEDIRFARQLLRKLGHVTGAPDVAPAPDGSICLEWVEATERGPKKIFVDVGPGNRVLTYLRLPNEKPREIHFGKDSPALVEYLTMLFIRFATK